MNHAYCPVVAALLLIFFPMIGMALPPADPSSGIAGVISVSPSRPGPLRKDGPSSAPVANTEFVVKQDEARVSSFKTEADGRFRIALPPGHYVVLREDPGAAIGHWRFEVDIRAGEITKVNWTGDSGMR